MTVKIDKTGNIEYVDKMCCDQFDKTTGISTDNGLICIFDMPQYDDLIHDNPVPIKFCPFCGEEIYYKEGD